VDEDQIMNAWSVDRFLRYADAADQLLELKAR